MAKVKVPKRVGGVKVPKKVRKQVKKALDLADSPAVRELAVAGLTMAAEALIDRRKPRRRSARDGAEDAQGSEPDRKDSASPIRGSLDALDLGEVLRAAAVEGARRFLEGYEEGKRDSEERSSSGQRRIKASDAPAE